MSSNLEKKVKWNRISNLRFDYLRNYIDQNCASILTDSILNNLKDYMDGNKASAVVMNFNMSKSDFNGDVEMFFVVLNSCPSFLEKLYWKVLYGIGPTSRISLLASNILKKAKGTDKMRALKIFSKISSVLGFQHISYHHEGNKSVGGNIILTKNVMEIQGEIRKIMKRSFKAFPDMFI